MPNMKYEVPPTSKELPESRQEELDSLTDFEAYEWWPIGQTEGGKWIKSRWEESRKDSGVYRSRWVLQEFANKSVDGDFFSPTPDSYEIDLIHLKALIE